LEYSLLRPAFLEQTSKPRLIDKLDTLLICFGGSDSLNLTVKTLKVVTNKYPFIKIIIVTGAAYNQFDNLFPLIRLHKRIEHYNNVDAEKMVSLMLESNLSIAPSSSILLELFSVGVPAITGYYVENQKTGSAALSDIGLAISCGDMNNDYSKKLNDILKNYTLDVGIQMVKNQKAIKWAGKNYYINIFKAL
jgi:spore coat polysaccharide biosynthesis predicted glycosyltransferase SpsG